jgi:5-methyltetrahydropteroyltriglutamate--homocysteine methyltransferase
MARILTTHVGSLPRGQAVVDFLFARERGEPFDRAAFGACMAEACAETVRRQVEAGIDIVSDGETAKISYATYVKDRYTGFEGDSPRNAPADLKLFPRFLERIANSGGTPQYARPCCTGPVRPKDDRDLRADIENLTAAMAEHGASRGFMNAASRGAVSLFLPNRHYPSREAYLAALAEAMRAEYEAIVAAGLDLQLDCPDLALSRHMLFADLSDDEFVRIAETHVEALNHALAGVPAEKVRVHICWGNYEGPHVCDIALGKVFATLMKAKARCLLFESANPRHGHEWAVFRDRRPRSPTTRSWCPASSTARPTSSSTRSSWPSGSAGSRASSARTA